MKKQIRIAILVAVVAVTGCSKNFLNVNQNLNQPTAVPEGLVFTNATNQTATQYATNIPQVLQLWLGQWSRSGNYIPDNATETYEISPGYSYSENLWQVAYSINLNLNFVQQEATKLRDPYLKALSRILMAYNFGQLVDVYDDIPYHDALNIDSLRPKYDNAQAIYTDLFTQIDSGIALLKTVEDPGDANVAADGQYDIIYGGNPVSWIQFANTIKLRLMLHVSQVSNMQSIINSQLAEIAQEGDGFLAAGNGAMANPGYSNSIGKQSPFFGTFGFTPTGTPSPNNAYFRVNRYATNFYVATNDPRGVYFAAKTTSAYTGNDTISGNYQGDPTAQGNSNTSAIGPGLLGTPQSPTPIMADFESLFLQAQATQLGWLTGGPTAQQLYESAVTQNFVYLGVNNATSAAQTYLAQAINDVGWNASPNKMEAIIKQKWVAMNGVDILEAWNDYRRLTLPADIPISKNPHLTTPQIPVRLLYPQTELDRNPTNVPQLANGAQFNSKIFWMQ
jgi:hypothetical protein